MVDSCLPIILFLLHIWREPVLELDAKILKV